MRRILCLGVAVTVVALSACTSGGTPQETTAPPSRTAASTQSSSAASTAAASTSAASTAGTSAPTRPRTTAPVDRASATLARMSLAERVGQLFMVDCPTGGVGAATVTAIQRHHVGSIILDGTTGQGVAATSAVTRQLQRLAPSRLKLFISADQEGGQVQRLQGPGFSTIPSAAVQGTLTTTTLRRQATGWGRELRAAGVNVDLAPVLDTVPPGGAPNPPIGDLDRAFGTDTATVSTHGRAVIDGLAAAGVTAAVKHFPGLGRVAANTDYSAGVIDTVTTRDDPYLRPFADAIRDGAGRDRQPFVMMSTAIYARIDPDNPAAFSTTIVTGMLRDDLGFKGVIVSDDVGGAAQVSGYTPAQRAVQFLAAGGTMVLTVDPTQVPSMTSTVIAKARAEPGFRAAVNAAALVVLRAKLAAGLLR